MRELAAHCPSCMSEGVWDLADTELADRIRELEEQNRSDVPADVRARSWGFSGVAGLGAATGATLLFGPLVGFLTLLLVPVSLSVSASRGAAGALQQLHGRRLPSRWRLPKGPDSGSATGPVVASGPARAAEMLASPLSKTPCVAWRVLVDFHPCDNSWPRERVVDEGEGGALLVGDRALKADSYVLDASATPSPDEESARRYLRTRGLFINDGHFRIHESVLREGELVELCVCDPPRVRRPLHVATFGGTDRLG